MIDLGRAIESAVRADWSEQRIDTVHAGLRLRQRRRAVARVALGSVIAVAVLVGGWMMWPSGGDTPARSIAARPPEPSTTLRFGDGSTVVPVGSDSQVREVGRVAVEVVRGGARFEIVEDRARVFRVTSGRVTIEAFGAVFTTSQLDQQTRIEVFRGAVRVGWADQQRELTAGETGVFPPSSAKQPEATHPAESPRVRPARVVKDNWRDLAHEGEYDRAYAALERPGVPAVRDEPEELLLLADVKRLSHHPAEALAPLRQIVRDHAADPRVSLAAFTLGRVLLEELGRPAEAADAFASAVRFAPDGPMAEDAIAREVEALSRAGDGTAAQHLAEDYLKRFPAGRKVRSVRRFGGLE